MNFRCSFFNSLKHYSSPQECSLEIYLKYILFRRIHVKIYNFYQIESFDLLICWDTFVSTARRLMHGTMFQTYISDNDVFKNEGYYRQIYVLNVNVSLFRKFYSSCPRCLSDFLSVPFDDWVHHNVNRVSRRWSNVGCTFDDQGPVCGILSSYQYFFSVETNFICQLISAWIACILIMLHTVWKFWTNVDFIVPIRLECNWEMIMGEQKLVSISCTLHLHEMLFKLWSWRGLCWFQVYDIASEFSVSLIH